MSGSTSEPLYSEAQQLVLVTIPYFPATLSLIGSSLILYVSWKDRKNRMKQVYHRLIVGLSSMDFLNSFGMVVFGHWAVPKQVDYVPGAKGTFATCDVAGWFLMLILGTKYYFFFLSLYFVLRIRFELSEDKLARWIEPIGHVVSVVFPVVMGSVSAAMGWINPLEQLPGFCWQNDFPSGCPSDDSVPCLRKNSIPQAVIAVNIVVLWFGVVVCMILLVLKVRRTEHRLRSYTGGASSTLVQTRQTGVQALWYIFAFFFVYFPVVAVMFLGDDFNSSKRSIFFTFAFLTKLLTPLQGALNSFIYFRRSFRSLTLEGNVLSCLRCLTRHKPPASTPTTRRSHGEQLREEHVQFEDQVA